MPRNGSGTYSLPQAAFTPGTTISSAAVNSDFSDIANALTGSVASDGQTPITGVFKFISGGISTPSVTFATDATSGLFSPATSELGLVAAGLGMIINGVAFTAATVAVNSGGNNYAVNDQVTLTNGINPIVIQVLTLSGSAINTISIVEAGRYITQPSNPVAQASTTGSGSGANFTVTWSGALAVTDLNNNALWQALGGTAFFANNIVNANSIAAFLGADSVSAYNLANSALGFNAPINLTLTATNPANALTVAVKTAVGTDPTPTNPVLIPLRDPTIANGDPVVLSVTSALSVATPTSAATLGVSNGTGQTSFRFWVVVFNNAGTPIMGLWNAVGTSSGLVTGINSLDEATPASSTALNGSSTSAGVFYTSGGTVTSKSFRILGYVDYAGGLVTPGTYTSLPTKVQLMGPTIRLPGSTVQLFTTQTSTVVTTTVIASAFVITTSAVPVTATMGGQFMSQAITPSFQGNVLEIESQAYLSANNIAQPGGIGLFLIQDATNTALTAAYVNPPTTSAIPLLMFVRLSYRMLAGTVSATTMKIFGGGGTSSTVAMNGDANTTAANTTAVLNGTQCNSYVTVKEIMT